MFDFFYHIPFIGGFLTAAVPFLIVLSIVVFIHEFGHYIVGRWCGIQAEVFSVGFGPVLTSRVDKSGTKWQIAAIPLGGYVRFLGDANAASGLSDIPIDDAIKHKTLNGAALYKRALTVFAGPAANFILSSIVFAGIAYYLGQMSNEPVVGQLEPLPQSAEFDLRTGDHIKAVNDTPVESFEAIIKLFDKAEASTKVRYRIERDGQDLDVLGPFLTPPLVGAVLPVSPASKAGLKEGDVILSINEKPLLSFSDLVALVRDAGNHPVDLIIWRDGSEKKIQITPEYRDIQIGKNEFEQRLMIGLTNSFAFLAPIESISISQAVTLGIERTIFVITSSITGIYQILIGKLSAKNFQGPFGIAQMSGDTASSGLLDFIALIAFISTAIGFVNLLPIPVLDGGHLLMYGYEAIFRRPPGQKATQIAMTMGLTLLLSLMIFATWNDFARMF